jgi:hypothetical protein
VITAPRGPFVIREISEKAPPGGSHRKYSCWLEDTRDESCVFVDGGEPEDQILTRDLSDLVDALNIESTRRDQSLDVLILRLSQRAAWLRAEYLKGGKTEDHERECLHIIDLVKDVRGAT